MSVFSNTVLWLVAAGCNQRGTYWYYLQPLMEAVWKQMVR